MRQIVTFITAFVLSSLIALQTQVHAQVVNPDWVSLTFTFRWPNENSTLTHCRILNITFENRPSAVPTPQPPYSIILSHANYAPLTVNAGSNCSFLWPVNLDLGGPYLLSAYDIAGATGGTGLASNVMADTISNATCGSSGMASSTLDFNLSGVPSQCGIAPMTVSGGKPPYVVSFVTENYPPKRANFASGNIDWTIDLKAGINTYFTVTDSLGNGAVSQFFNIAASSNSSCLATAQMLAPGSPALSTVYLGTGVGTATTGTAPSASSTSKSSSNLIFQVPTALLAMSALSAMIVTTPL